MLLLGIPPYLFPSFFFFNDTATTEIYTLSLHDALPISVRTAGHQRPLRLREERAAVQPAGLRHAAVRPAPAGGRRLPVGPVADHGAAHSRALARPDAPARHRRRTLVAHPAAESVRGPGRPLPGGLLLGLVLHDARAHRERPHRSRQEHARQLRPPDRNGRAHPERQPDVLSEPQSAALLRRHGGVVRAGDGYDPGPSIPRGAGGGARVLDEWGGASRTRVRPGVPPRRPAAGGRPAAQPLLGRPARAQA